MSCNPFKDHVRKNVEMKTLMNLNAIDALSALKKGGC